MHALVAEEVFLPDGTFLPLPKLAVEPFLKLWDQEVFALRQIAAGGGASLHASIDTRLPTRNITHHDHEAEAILPAPHRLKEGLSAQAPRDSAVSDRGHIGLVALASRTPRR